MLQKGESRMLKLESISFSYEKKPVLKDFSLQLENGEILAATVHTLK